MGLLGSREQLPAGVYMYGNTASGHIDFGRQLLQCRMCRSLGLWRAVACINDPNGPGGHRGAI